MLVPGLFSNADVGEAWPDGDGSFHLDGATPYSTADAVDFSNAFHLDAIVFKQLRANSVPADQLKCYNGHVCLQYGADVPDPLPPPHAPSTAISSHQNYSGANSRIPRGAAGCTSPLASRRHASIAALPP